MNFKYYLIIPIILFLSNCSNNVNLKKFTTVENFSNKGFTLVFEDKLYNDKIVDKKIDNRSYLIFQKNLRKNSSVKITNMLNNKTILAKVASNKTNYPYFYNSVISERIAEDLEIPIELYVSNLIYDDSKPGELMQISLNKEDAVNWLGAVPPDLTLEARVRKPEWIYTYLKSFYSDSSRPYGVNNLVYKNVSMPHVLEDLQN